MTREQAEQIAGNHLGYGWAPLWAIDAIMEAVAVEREECAKVCDDLHYSWRWDDNTSGPAECAETIRARGGQ